MPNPTNKTTSIVPGGYLALLDHFRSKTVMVVGDLVADEFVYCDISRVSREAPVLIIKHRHTTIVPGGGGNAAYNLAALGARVIPVGIVGSDGPGHALVECFRSQGVDTRSIAVARGHTTVTKSRILAGMGHGSRQQVVRIDREPPQPLPEQRRLQLERWARRLLSRADAVLLSDYGYGAATPGLAETLKPLLRGRPLMIDSRFRLLQYQGATAAAPNEFEAEEACGVRLNNDARRLEQAGRGLLRKMKIEALLITRGREGMALFQPGRPTLHIPIWGTDEVTDVTGAGDTVIAVFTLAVAAGADFEQAARLANFAGGIVVMKRGTATVSHDELRRAVVAAGGRRHGRGTPAT
jgi:rfaE bifunctional protein kinase chain/domain